MNKQTIWLDMDDVICDFLTQLCFEYNFQYNKNIQPSDIKTWDLSAYIGKRGIKIFQEPGFFFSLKPIKNAIETIQFLLYEGNEIFIISNPPNEYAILDKYKWIKKYLPFFPIENLILVGNKGDLLNKINEGILFDDCPEYLNKFKGITVVMDMPYNQNIKSDFRVNNWKDFYEVVNYLNLSNSTNFISHNFL